MKGRNREFNLIWEGFPEEVTLKLKDEEEAYERSVMHGQGRGGNMRIAPC